MWSRASRPFLFEALEVEALRGEVGLEVARGLLEAHEQPGLAELFGAVDYEAHGKDGLAAAGRTCDERDAALGQAAFGDLVEALDPGGDLGQRNRGGCVGYGCHGYLHVGQRANNPRRPPKLAG